MSQEIQLYPGGGSNSSSSAIVPWAQSSGALGAPAQPTPLRKMHRLLRGRYVLAFVLASIGAAAGGVWGYMSQTPGWKSMGLIEIQPTIPDPDSYDKVMQMYGAFMQSQVARLQSERLIKFAIDRDEYKALRPDQSPTAIADFAKNLAVQHRRNSSLLEVVFTDPDKDVAPVAVIAVIESYDKHFSKIDYTFIQKKILFHQEKRDEAAKTIEQQEKKIASIADKYGYDYLSDQVKAKWAEVRAYEAMVREAEDSLAAAKAPVPAGQQLAPDDIARNDPGMARLIATRDHMQAQLDAMVNVGPAHPTVVATKKQIAAQEARIEKYAAEFRTRIKGIQPNLSGGPAQFIPANVKQMEASVVALRETLAEAEKAAKEWGQADREIRTARDEIVQQTEALKEAEKKLEQLRFQQDMVGRLDVISHGDAAVTAIDNRAKFGVLGLLAGGALPIALLMFIGLLDSRYRYSDEAGTEIQGITLLGILPNLPDRLSDPEQAAIAAHCVHQIRTMLQINGGPQERRVIAVTSASPGDGKTSLTLALGLSYAACGTRTLLIDCDLVGAGLTHRMNVNSTDGVLEAIANRSLLEYVRTTDIADVAMLPVGSARGHHASTLSPVALRRLVEQAKEHFEMILIDTGPVLGSIEASMVCAAADGTVLTVARGQNRPLVEKSLSHLAAIGARLAGVVFNRAQASDFERSISGMSMRSVAAQNGNGHGGAVRRADSETRFGPVARAVQSSARGDVQN